METFKLEMQRIIKMNKNCCTNYLRNKLQQETERRNNEDIIK